MRKPWNMVPDHHNRPQLIHIDTGWPPTAGKNYDSHISGWQRKSGRVTKIMLIFVIVRQWISPMMHSCLAQNLFKNWYAVQVAVVATRAMVCCAVCHFQRSMANYPWVSNNGGVDGNIASPPLQPNSIIAFYYCLVFCDRLISPVSWQPSAWQPTA